MPLTFRGYSVHVQSEGKELPQFQVEEVDERTITCWMPSEAGKTFAVRCSTVHPHDHVYKCVYLDADGRELSSVADEDNNARTISHRRISNSSKQEFFFSEVTLNPDDGDHDTVTRSLKDLAVIEAEIWPAERIKRDVPLVVVGAGRVPDGDVSLSERSKLIGANHVKYGPELYCAPQLSHHVYKIQGHEPYAIFRFKHRPPAVLQAMGIMPRDQESIAPVVASSSELIAREQSGSPSDTVGRARKRKRVKEEVLDVQHTANNGLEAKRRRIKAKIAAERAEAATHEAKALALEADLEELEATAPAGRVRVKSEHAPSPIRSLQSGEVVDLTDD
ncbi:unnamed protein product [Peniophora sp. CBMAI 1063]|nr:unnamed protein product [Peniophora sp. CBMAI 1063]